MLDRISVKSPCTESWDEMEGDDRSRLCFRCTKTVYDLGAMDAEESEAFIEKHLRSRESVCVRFHRRPDGRVLTSECAPGIRARHLHRTVKVISTTVAGATLTAMAGISLTTLHPDLPNDEPTTAELLTRDLPSTGREMRKNAEPDPGMCMGDLDVSETVSPDLPFRYHWHDDGDPENEREGTAARTARTRAEEAAERETPVAAPVSVRLVARRSLL